MRAHSGAGAGDIRYTRTLACVLLLTGGFMIAEFAVALWTGSLALLVDAGHIKIGPTAISSATAKMKF